jgi:hypothetical protein
MLHDKGVTLLVLICMAGVYQGLHFLRGQDGSQLVMLINPRLSGGLATPHQPQGRRLFNQADFRVRSGSGG